MNVLQKLRQLAGEVAKSGSADAWALAERLLSRLPADQAEVGRACAARDPIALDAIISRLENPAPSKPAHAALPEETLKAALRAFNKRLKLSRLADESRLGNKYVTAGRKSDIDAIIPPNDFPPEVWRSLAASGRLKDVGGGFYAPAESAHPDAMA